MPSTIVSNAEARNQFSKVSHSVVKLPSRQYAAERQGSQSRSSSPQGGLRVNVFHEGSRPISGPGGAQIYDNR